MKKLMMILTALTVVAVSAQPLRWIGPNGGFANDPDNWSPRSAQAKGDILVFNPGEGVCLTVDVCEVGTERTPIGGLSVESGTVVLWGKNIDTANSTQLYFLNGATNEIHVVDGAELLIRTVIYPGASATKPESAHCHLLKTGAGLFTHEANAWCDGRYKFRDIRVQEGGYHEKRKTPQYWQISIADGAWAKFDSEDTFVGTEVLHVEEGGTLTVRGFQNVVKPRGIEGGGTINLIYVSGTSKWVEPNLSGGPYRFSGIIRREASQTQGSWGFRNYAAKSGWVPSDEERHMVIAGSNTLECVSCFNPTITAEWGRGVGEYWSAPLLGAAGVPITTEDEDGEPIRLHANLAADSTWGFGAATTELVGSGDWFVRSGSTTVTGRQVRVTGTVGVPSGATMTFGDGVHAAADVAEYPFSVAVDGTVVYKSVEPRSQETPLTGAGNISVLGPTTLADFRMATTCFTVGANAKVTGGSPTVQKVKFSDSGKLTLSGAAASFRGPLTSDLNGEESLHTTKKPLGVRFEGATANNVLRLENGAEFAFWYNEVTDVPGLELVDRGRFTVGKDNGWSTSAAEVSTVWSDGGVIGLTCWLNASGVTFPAKSKADSWRAVVGPGGLVYSYRDSTLGRYASINVWNCYLAATSGVADGTDGGIVLRAAGQFSLYRPQNVTGPFVLQDGRLILQPTALSATQATLGTGDLVFDGGWLDLSTGAASSAETFDLVCAAAEGAKGVVRGASRLDLASGTYANPRTLTIGPAGTTGPSLVQERGGILFVRTSGNVLDGTATKVLVNGGVAAHADGRTKVPVVGDLNGAQSFRFMKYGATSGLVSMGTDEYVTDIDLADGRVCYLNHTGSASRLDIADGTKKAGALQIHQGSASVSAVTIGSGAALKVGDGENPAVVLLSQGNSVTVPVIAGPGTLDFGDSEGIFVTPTKFAKDVYMAQTISATITGRNGVMFASEPGDLSTGSSGLNAHFCVASANDYEGGTVIDHTDVRVENPLAFSTGDVRVIGGRMVGGSVLFNDVGPFANRFVVNAYGRKRGDWDRVQHGVLEFAASGTRLTGVVDIVGDGAARFTANYAPAGADAAVFEGEVRGGRLEVVYAANAPLVFTQKNDSWTGGVEVISSTVVLRGATPTLGSGDVLLDNGTLRFENTQALSFGNRLWGTGVIQLAGSAPVTFVGDLKDYETKTLDLAGDASVVADLAPFRSIVNSSDKVATLQLAANLGTVAWDGRSLDPANKINLAIGAGTVLDLGGATLTVRRALDDAATHVINGTLEETNPKRGMILIVR